MTAEALSAAEADVSPQSAAAAGSPRPVTDGDAAPDLAEATQSVVDVVAARLAQVAAQDGTGPNGQHPDRDHADGPRADRDHADGGPADGGHADGGPADGSRVDGDHVDSAYADGFLADRFHADGVHADGARADARADAAHIDGSRADGARAEVGDADGHHLVGDSSSGEAASVDVVAGALPAPEPTADTGRFAAGAVLDVLRASGWADADEAQQLRAEANRLRELLDMVVRDHRAREASAAGLESQQHHWLIPLLRAAHGVAFGSLGAKVALRTAVQEVPEQILASAGLRIDYGVEQSGEAGEGR